MQSEVQQLSVVMITLNEAENLRRSLPPLSRISDDIVVIDAGSTDETVRVAEEFGATVEIRKWEGYSSAKNHGNARARHDWILSIDADEVLSDELVQSIKNLSPAEGTVYALDRITNFAGTWIRHSGWYPDWKIRLFDRRYVRWHGDFVHERPDVPAGFATERLTGRLLHYSYASTDDHLGRIERYAELSARDLYNRGKRRTLLSRMLSPLFRFLRTYIFKLGFLDGRKGWLISVRNARLVRLKYRRLRELVRQGGPKP